MKSGRSLESRGAARSQEKNLGRSSASSEATYSDEEDTELNSQERAIRKKWRASWATRRALPELAETEATDVPWRGASYPASRAIDIEPTTGFGVLERPLSSLLETAVTPKPEVDVDGDDETTGSSPSAVYELDDFASVFDYDTTTDRPVTRSQSLPIRIGGPPPQLALTTGPAAADHHRPSTTPVPEAAPDGPDPPGNDAPWYNWLNWCNKAYARRLR